MLAIAGLAGLLVVCTALVWVITNPVFFRPNVIPGLPPADPARLRADVEGLVAGFPARAFPDSRMLKRAADHIAAEFERSGCKPVWQSYTIDGNDYHNVICSRGPADAPRVIIGAHYDVAGTDNPGADDNASGVAALLELSRLLETAGPDLAYRLDLVAFTLEEPPNFRSDRMGSYVHAKSLSEAGTDVRLMISVEMIGYFSDEPGSQHFPVTGLGLIYPDKGNFIAVIGRAFDRETVARTKALMQAGNTLSVYSLNAPAHVTGVDFSDHRNFWRTGYPAVMVTNTAFFRNPNYHTAGDTPETLDYERMARVVDGLFRVAVDY